MVIYVVSIYALIAVIDPYGLRKKRMKRDFLVCSVLYLISFALAFALSMHWEIPSPSPLIVDLVKRLY